MCTAVRLQEAAWEALSEIVIQEGNLLPGGLLQSTHLNGYGWDNEVFNFRNQPS